MCQRGCKLPHRTHAVDVCEVRLQLAQPFARLVGKLTLRNIHHRTDDLNKVSARTQNGMANGMNVFDCSIGFHNSKLDVTMYLLKERLITSHPELVTVFWVYSLFPFVPLRLALLCIKAEESKHFLGPVKDLVTGAIKSTTARVGQPLSFGQIGFAALESTLCCFAFLYISVCAVPFDNFPVVVE